MWRFWLEFKAFEPSVQLGGIYAVKPGYHNARDNLPASDYSVQLPADKLGSGASAAAIDLTFPDAQSARYDTIIKYADRLLRSGVDPNDPRGNRLREFYGQADQDTKVEGWDFQHLVPVTSDSSHLWHIHLSFLRQYQQEWEGFRDVLSILRGETTQQWHDSVNQPPAPPEEEDVAISADLAASLDDMTWRIDAIYFNRPEIIGGRLDSVPAQNPNALHSKLEEILAATKAPTAPVDLDALADLLVDKIIARLQK